MAHSMKDIPNIGLTFRPSYMVSEALSYAGKHCDVMTYNHAVRSAYFAAIISKKLPLYLKSEVDLEAVLVSCILHDMGWAETKTLLSNDKRFEVDGADIAKEFMSSTRLKKGEDETWSEERIQRCWYAIALHTTPSIAMHSNKEVALTNLGILGDFAGPLFPGGRAEDLDSVITKEEFKAVTELLPRTGFDAEGLKGVMCGLCRDKPSTTYDNFVGQFGAEFGLDGKGAGKEKFAAECQENASMNMLLAFLNAVEELRI